MATEHKDALGKAHVDMNLLEQAKDLNQSLNDLIAQIAIDPKKVNETQLLCSKAWTYLKEALDEIYAAGRFVFMDQPEVEEMFYGDYFQKVGKMRQSAVETAAPVVA